LDIKDLELLWNKSNKNKEKEEEKETNIEI
jgi:hypothetical protein